MKKLSFFLMAMLFSVMSFAAESLLVTLDFSKNTWGLPVASANKTTATVSYTNGDYAITLAGGGNGNGHYYNNDGYLIFGKSGATLTLPAFDFKTTKIVVTGRNGASTSVLQNIYVGAAAVSTQTKGAAVTNTYAIAEDYQAAGNVYVLKVTSSHNTQIVKMEIYGEEGGEQGEKVDAPKFSVTETNFKEAFDLTISSAEGTTLKYTTDNTDPKTSATAVSVETNTANVAIPAKSTVVKAVAMKGDLVSVVASTIYAYVNSPETAYTIAEAMEVIDAGLGLENELYVKGEISTIEEYNATYGSITYWIKDEEGNKFECYSGLGLNKAKFTSIDDLVVGSKVVVCGTMKKFNTTYEFNYNNYIVSLELPVVTHDFYVENVTLTEGQWSIDLAGSWNEQAFILKLWQDSTQGFGTYAANAETGYAATLGVKELTPTTEGNFMQDPMNENAFIFQGTMTDGTDIYEVFLKGALASSTGTGELEAKNEVYFTYEDGEWMIEAFADDETWGLMLAVSAETDPETGENLVYGQYVTDIEAGVSEEVAGTGMLYFDDFSGCYVFKGGLATASGNIYPTLYASSLTLMTNKLMTDASWVGEFAGVDYYEVLMMAADYSWELDLHARNCTGANGTYTIDVVDEAEGAYSTFMGSTIVTGELTIEDGMYEANVTTVDSEGNPVMSISVSAWEAEAAEYNVVIENATVTKNNAGYNIDLTGEWDGHTIKVEVCDELTAETISANFFIDGGIANGGDQAEGKVTATVSEGVVTITGAFECLGSGNVYNVTISGKLPEGVSTDLENNTITVKAAKVIRNGKLIIRQGDVEFNAQGAIIK